VLWPEAPAVLALHFGFSLIAFAGVLLLALALGSSMRRSVAADVPASLRRIAWVTLAFIYALVYLGAYVAHSGAAMACLGWPLCNGSIVPGLHGAVAVNFVHRLGALVAVALIAALVLRTRRVRAERPEIHRAAHLAAALVVRQPSLPRLDPAAQHAGRAAVRRARLPLRRTRAGVVIKPR
jgi:cytochrome c oxidase assembly protein subunit 15